MIIGKKINTLLDLGGDHAYYYHAGDWYHPLKRFPGVLFDERGYVKFNNESDYLNHPGIKHQSRIHIKHGIKSFQGYIEFSERELDLIAVEILKNPTEKTIRSRREINQINRNQTYVRDLKTLYDNSCQICAAKVKVGPKSYYSEVHHIKPLGTPHNGADQKDNMIVVCPNCHVKLDSGFLKLKVRKMNIKHEINRANIRYHNQR